MIIRRVIMTTAMAALGGCFWTSEEPPPPPSTAQLRAACYPEDIGRQSTDTSACLELARQGLAENGPTEQVLKDFNRSCFDRPEACVELGLLHLGGKGLPQDLTEARKAFGSGCVQGSGDACGWKTILVLHAHADASPKRRFANEATMRNSCSDTGWPCTNYGVALACGYFGAPDVPFARHVLDRGCTLGDGRACTVSNRLQVDPEDRPECGLIGPDPDHPVDLELDLTPGPPDLLPDPEHVRRWRAPMRSPVP